MHGIVKLTPVVNTEGFAVPYRHGSKLTLTELARRLGRTRYAVAVARHRATHDPKWMKVAGVDDA